MRRKIVTIGTDGFCDYLRVDEAKYNLGAVSVLKLVTETSADIWEAKDTVEAFLRDGEATFAADLDRVDELCAPARPRFAFQWDWSAPPRPESKHLSPETVYMAHDPLSDATKQGIANIEREIGLLEQSARDNKGITADQAKSTVAVLKKIIGEMRSPGGSIAGKDQSDNSTYYKLGAEGEQIEGVFTKMHKTADKIRALSAAGKNFNAKRALDDVYEVTTGVTALLDTPDLATVTPEIQKLASRADHLHGLFFPKG